MQRSIFFFRIEIALAILITIFCRNLKNSKAIKHRPWIQASKTSFTLTWSLESWKSRSSKQTQSFCCKLQLTVYEETNNCGGNIFEGRFPNTFLAWSLCGNVCGIGTNARPVSVSYGSLVVKVDTGAKTWVWNVSFVWPCDSAAVTKPDDEISSFSTVINFKFKFIS